MKIWNVLHMSQSQLVWSFESQSRVKVKVVKWCRKKWFDHNQMYIYHKQCEILQKNHRNSSNIQFQWFPIEKGRKLCKRKRWNGWSKSIVLENKVVVNFDFRSGAKKSGHLDYPFQSYGPIMHKTCREVLSKKTNTFIILQIEAWNEYQMGPVGLGRGDINFKPQFAVWRKC